MTKPMTADEALAAASAVYDALEEYARAVVRLEGRAENAERKNTALIARNAELESLTEKAKRLIGEREVKIAALIAEREALRAEVEGLNNLLIHAREFSVLNYTLNRLDAHSIAEGIELFNRERLIEDKEKAYSRLLVAIRAIDAARAESGSHE